MVVTKIGVIGAGQMGHGITLVSAQAGYDVLLHDMKEEYVQKGLAAIEKFINKSVEKGKITADDKKKIMGKIRVNEKILINFGFITSAFFLVWLSLITIIKYDLNPFVKLVS